MFMDRGRSASVDLVYGVKDVGKTDACEVELRNELLQGGELFSRLVGKTLKCVGGDVAAASGGGENDPSARQLRVGFLNGVRVDPDRDGELAEGGEERTWRINAEKDIALDPFDDLLVYGDL